MADLKKGCKEDGIDYLFSLTTFDTQVDTPIVAKPVGEISEDALMPHGPRGSTALYDAVGKTLKNTEDNSHGADKIVVVIVTDGYENSSREWSKDALHAAIEAKLKLGNWTFTYLGTQPETWADAQSLGIGVGATSTYTGHMANAAYQTTSQAVRGMARSSAMASRSLMHEHSTVQARAAVGMGTRPGQRIKPPMPKSPGMPSIARVIHPPVPPASGSVKDTRRWK